MMAVRIRLSCLVTDICAEPDPSIGVLAEIFVQLFLLSEV